MCSGGKSLEFRPKAHKKDVDSYVDACRTKFGCFESEGLDDDLTGIYGNSIQCTFMSSKIDAPYPKLI